MNNPITPGDEQLDGNIGKLMSSMEPRLAMPESSKARALSALLRSAEAAQPITETQVTPDLMTNTQDLTQPMVRLVPDVPTDWADGVSRETRPTEQPPSRRHARRRFLAMFYPKRLRWSAAAALAAGVLLAIGFWPGKSDRGPGSAFAAAIHQFQKARTMVCRISTTAPTVSGPIQQTGKLYLSSEHGTRCEMGWGASPMLIEYSPPQGPVTTVMPLNHAYSVKDLEAVRGHGHGPLNADHPHAFILLLSKLKGHANRELGRAAVDGVDSLGYEVTGELLGFGSAEGVRSELWVNAQTYLPLRYVAEMPMPEAAGVPNGMLQLVYDQFEWDTPLDPKLFVPAIPADYTRIDVKAPAPDEAALMKGLGNYVELAEKYPATMDGATIGMDLAVLGGRRRGIAMARGEEPPDEKVQAQKVMEIASGIAFYQTLVRDGRSPEYFGKDVSPGQGESVLVRWQTEDGQWRVIYGDLRVETIASP